MDRDGLNLIEEFMILDVLEELTLIEHFGHIYTNKLIDVFSQFCLCIKCCC